MLRSVLAARIVDGSRTMEVEACYLRLRLCLIRPGSSRLVAPHPGKIALSADSRSK